MESHRFAASGGGPGPECMLLGSEGHLGLVTQAWVRLRPQPTFRAATIGRFPAFFRAAKVRSIPHGCSIRECSLIHSERQGKIYACSIRLPSAPVKTAVILSRVLFSTCARSGGKSG